MKKIEDTIFDVDLPVNTISMFNRGIEILQENNCNNPSSLKGEAKLQYRKLMWLLCQQIYNYELTLSDEWRDLTNDRK